VSTQPKSFITPEQYLEIERKADVAAICGERKFQDGIVPDTLLSPSTEAYDRGQKFDHYKSVESVRQYLLIAVNRIHADLYTRQADNLWTLVSADRIEDSLDLQSVGCKLAMADVYENVDPTK